MNLKFSLKGIYNYISEDLIYNLISIITILLMTWIAVKFARRGLKYLLSHIDKSKNHKQYSFIIHLVSGAIYTVGILLAFNTIPIFKPIVYSIFASSSVLALALGLASQQAASQIVGGFFIQLFKPFVVGDHVKIGKDTEGIVKDITLRHTILKSKNNKLTLVPNATVNSSIIENISESQK